MPRYFIIFFTASVWTLWDFAALLFPYNWVYHIVWQQQTLKWKLLDCLICTNLSDVHVTFFMATWGLVYGSLYYLKKNASIEKFLVFNEPAPRSTGPVELSCLWMASMWPVDSLSKTHCYTFDRQVRVLAHPAVNISCCFCLNISSAV